jgi:hypothetical protein
MFNRLSDKQLFFSTTSELKIDGMVYRPSICYPVPSLAKKSLEKYAADGKVVFYPTKVRFVNGAVVIPATEKTASVAAIVEDTYKTSSKKGK